MQYIEQIITAMYVPKSSRSIYNARDLLCLQQKGLCGELSYITVCTSLSNVRQICICVNDVWSFNTSTLMLETDKVSETLVFNSALTWLIAPRYFSTFISRKSFNIAEFSDIFWLNFKLLVGSFYHQTVLKICLLDLPLIYLERIAEMREIWIPANRVINKKLFNTWVWQIF
jgi:hypothetical protein